MTSADLFPDVKPHLGNEDDNQRYTTEPTLTWCKKVLGVDAFDLDVAACLESHKAPRWFGRLEFGGLAGHCGPDGLAAPWEARRIWCNPPYDDLRPWVAKAWSEILSVASRDPHEMVIGMLIPDNRREQPFWQQLIEPYRDGRWDRGQHVHPAEFEIALVALDADVRLFTHSLPGRQAFGVPGNPQGIGQQSPPFGVCLLEWRFA